MDEVSVLKQKDIIGFYGHTQEEFMAACDSLTTGNSEEMHKMLSFYQLDIMYQIQDLLKEGYIRFAAIINNGVCDWVADKLIREKEETCGSRIELTLILPNGSSRDSYTDKQWDYIRSADHCIIYGEGNERAVCTRLVDISNRILLYSFDAQAEYILEAARIGGREITCFDPRDCLTEYLDFINKR